MVKVYQSQPKGVTFLLNLLKFTSVSREVQRQRKLVFGNKMLHEQLADITYTKAIFLSRLNLDEVPKQSNQECT